jgi:cytochrome P450
MGDRDQLPYIDAFAKEVFRFNVVAPNGVAHAVTQDDLFGGYSIPAHSIVITNLEAMLHDSRMYKDPYKFDLTRFLSGTSGEAPERDPHTIGFGFGRRKCSGVKVADTNIFIFCAMVAAALDVQTASKGGPTIKPVYEKLSGSVSHPKLFDISIAPRSSKAEQLLRDMQLSEFTSSGKIIYLTCMPVSRSLIEAFDWFEL